jgi:hypothetical protein
MKKLNHDQKESKKERKKEGSQEKLQWLLIHDPKNYGAFYELIIMAKMNCLREL